MTKAQYRRTVALLRAAVRAADWPYVACLATELDAHDIELRKQAQYAGDLLRPIERDDNGTGNG